jgi:hypothetical protein
VHKLVIIEDSTITALLSNPKLLIAIPALKEAANAKAGGSPGCKPCQRKALAKSVNYSKAKRVISNLRGTQLAMVKEALDAEKIRVLVMTEGGRIAQITL